MLWLIHYPDWIIVIILWLILQYLHSRFDKSENAMVGTLPYPEDQTNNQRMDAGNVQVFTTIRYLQEKSNLY